MRFPFKVMSVLTFRQSKPIRNKENAATRDEPRQYYDEQKALAVCLLAGAEALVPFVRTVRHVVLHSPDTAIEAIEFFFEPT